MKHRLGLAASALIVIGLVLAYVLYLNLHSEGTRIMRLRQYWADPQSHADWELQGGERCGEAPFLMPSDGYVSFVWGDIMRAGHKHQGVDIFGPSGPDGLGQTPVVSAYDGYLTRLPDWRASVIIRIPEDPLQPGRSIWTYYTHMADADGNSFIVEAFPPGTYEAFIPAGTLLGYQGNYSADPQNPTGMHLHFSIVRDDGLGHFLNELEIGNTLDPSPYLGIELHTDRLGDAIPTCPDYAP
jgi:murein DD-endopeptidase MepM/ murein hydrolase activator NlpD